MIYTATITTASLRLRESKLIADLLLQGVDDSAWRQRVYEDNLLQMGSIESRKRVGGLLRARLEPLGSTLWEFVRDGDRELATQATFAGAVKQSRLLGDFMSLVLKEQRTLFAERIEPRLWNQYLEECRGRDPDMPHWSETTKKRLRSAVFSMLAEAGHLKDTKTLELQNVFVDQQLANLLRERGESYVLRCLEVTE